MKSVGRLLTWCPLRNNVQAALKKAGFAPRLVSAGAAMWEAGFKIVEEVLGQAGQK
jgi:hypothetical protein